MSKKDLSIIIVNYNTKELLRQCLTSIIENTQNINYEIIVVDNASSDGSQEAVKNEFPFIKLICSGVNHGFAKANNIGIREAKGEYILLLNSDTIVQPQCIFKIISYANSEPQAGIIGCKVYKADMSIQFSCWSFPNIISELTFFTVYLMSPKLDLIHWISYMKYWKYNTVRKVDCISGCFMLIKRTVFNEIGFLDEDFFMFYEDSEFCHRMANKTKLRTYFYPNSSIIHLGGGSSKKISVEHRKKIIQEWFLSAVKYFSKCESKYVSNFFVKICKIVWGCEALFFRTMQFLCKKKSTTLKILVYLRNI